MTEENKNAEYFVSKGKEYDKAGNYDLAIECFNNAIEFDPNYEWAYALKANSLFYKRNKEEAIVNIKKSIELNPHESKFHRGLGSMYWDWGCLDEASRSYKQAINIENNSKDHFSLGCLYFKKKNYNLCLKHIIIAIILDKIQS